MVIGGGWRRGGQVRCRGCALSARRPRDLGGEDRLYGNRETVGLGRSMRVAGCQRGLRHGAAGGAGEWCAGGVGEVVVPGVTGLLVPPGDAPAFAEAVRSLIVDRPRRAAFSEAARQRVKAEHDLSSAARRLNMVIDMVAPGRRA